MIVCALRLSRVADSCLVLAVDVSRLAVLAVWDGAGLRRRVLPTPWCGHGAWISVRPCIGRALVIAPAGT